jgi:hypothetical protein
LLVPGANASVDHIYPVSRFPHLKSDPANVEWVCSAVNILKREYTPEEFITLLQMILAYRVDNKSTSKPSASLLEILSTNPIHNPISKGRALKS